MKKVMKSSDGKYHVHGHKYDHLIGSRAQVWHGTAYKTAGGLTRKDLFYNKHGRIVSRAKHNTAKRERRLQKHGYTARKGKFGAVKMASNGRRRGHSKTKKKRGTKRR